MTRILHWALRIALVVIGLVVLYAGFTFAQVWWASRQDDTTPASAIIVMGAAQWDGRPSPVLKARLDHAADLYKQGKAGTIVVTGGKQIGDRVTQGFAGFEYLRNKGIPESALQVEVAGTNSYEELAASAGILRDAGLGNDVILVSDPYHALRISEIADEVGLQGRVSPTSTGASMQSFARETAAVGLGRILGYRRLSSLA